jgi:hypothetical protein
MEWCKEIGGSCRIRAAREVVFGRFHESGPTGLKAPGSHRIDYLAVTIETIIHATDSTKRQWVAIASAVSVEGDVIDGPDTNGCARDPVVMRTDRIRSMLCEAGVKREMIPLTDLYDLLRTAWADVRRMA